MKIETIIKRDGRRVEFEPGKITDAIMKAVNAVGGEDVDEAQRITSLVVEHLESLETNNISVSDIQDAVEKVLIETGHAQVAKEYILFRANRDRVRDMTSGLMRSIEELTFGSSNDIELKRENANIDGDTAMGTMLRYGSEVAKMFNLDNLVSPDIARAHKNGDIHIHDLDFMALTETCLTKDSKVILKLNGRKGDAVEVPISFFDKYLENLPDDTVVSLENVLIYEEGRFIKVKNCVRHRAAGKKILRIHSQAATIEVTDEHRLPVVNQSNLIDTLKAYEVQVGMRFLGYMYNDANIKYGEFQECDFTIDSIEEVEYGGEFVYDIETTSHYFMTNGVLVHNCCQIDIEKLFAGGFNTGHGFLREPGEIRSYAALACIAIQGNQNEMHRKIA